MKIKKFAIIQLNPGGCHPLIRLLAIACLACLPLLGSAQPAAFVSASYTNYYNYVSTTNAATASNSLSTLLGAYPRGATKNIAWATLLGNPTVQNALAQSRQTVLQGGGVALTKPDNNFALVADYTEYLFESSHEERFAWLRLQLVF